jgi:regulator of RNase E activity RraA
MTDGASQPMPDMQPIALDVFQALQALDTCSVANAIEATGVRLRDEGYADATVRCLFPDLPPLVGYAFTLRVGTAHPKVAGVRHVDHIDWAPQLLAVPEPRILVVQDVTSHPHTGSGLGEVHANICQAMGCTGVVTNGAVRDLPALRALGFHAFATFVSVSHAYVHVIEAGTPVQVGGMTVRCGDLLHGDRHGVLCIPPGVAAALPDIARDQRAQERKIIDYCRSPEFTVQGIAALLQQVQAERPLPE